GRDRRAPAVEQRLPGGGSEDPPSERADPRARPGRARGRAALLRDARGPGKSGADEGGMDLRRRPPVRRGLPTARRRCLPPPADPLASRSFSATKEVAQMTKTLAHCLRRRALL